MILMGLVLFGCDDTSTTTSSETSTDGDTVIETEPNYAVADSEQENCYDSSVSMVCASDGTAFYGQDAQNIGLINAQDYSDNGDQTITDNVTGIMWTQSPDIDGIGNDDGLITSDDKLSSDNGDTACNSLSHAGYSDWQLPNVKQLYSLMNFQGMDPENSGDVTTYLIPFIDTDFFDFAYGSTSDERIIDSQYATTSKYYNDEATEMMFGVNFADGRIKGYTEAFFGSDKTYFVLCMRDNSGYGTNVFEFTDESTTVTDKATGLMWARDDSGEGYDDGFDYANNLGWASQEQDDDNDYDLVIDTDAMNGAMSWQDALAYVQQINNENYLGYSDWRLPTIKELHTLVNLNSG